MSYAKMHDLNENHGRSREFSFDSCPNLFGRFYNCAYETRAQNFADHTPTFKHRNLLQVWSKFTIGRSHRMTAIMSKSCCFSTFFTLSHNKNPFNHECLELAEGCTAQQSQILPYPITLHKNWVY